METTAAKLLTEYVIDLVKQYHEELDLRGYDWEVLIEDCQKNPDDVIWITTEVIYHVQRNIVKASAQLQQEVNRLFEFIEYEDDYWILQVGDKFIRTSPYEKDVTIEFVNKVEKLVPVITFE